MRRRSHDRVVRLADRRGFAMYQAAWVADAASRSKGRRSEKRIARKLRRDLDAVTNALTESWSNGQTEGQINRLKTLKRAMYGRAGPELL